MIGERIAYGDDIAHGAAYFNTEQVVRDMTNGGLYGALIGLALTVGWRFLRPGQVAAEGRSPA